MNELITRVKNIQNKAKSLKWGSCVSDDTSIVFAVGHGVYKKTVYFRVRVTDAVTYAVDHLKEDGEEVCLDDRCVDYDSIIIFINRLLKQEFPSKNTGVPCGHYNTKFSSMEGELNGEDISRDF